MKPKQKDLRMYCITLYNLSPIQQGIQSAHSIVEYNKNCDEAGFALYAEWASQHKTIIILNGGTTQTLDQYHKDLEKIGVEVAHFREPDLGDVKTAIAFIVDMKNDSHVVQYLKSMRLV